MQIGYQIGQCRMYVEKGETNEFYSKQPLITENCTCGNCKFFENTVIKSDVQLFKNLKSMGVILERQPNINPDGVSCVGDTEKYKYGYMGNYIVFGRFGKTQKQPQKLSQNGELESVRFEENGETFYCSYDIVQVEDNKLDFQFWIEIDKKAKKTQKN